MDDLEYIEQALQGNSTAYEALVRKYQDRLFGMLSHFMGNLEEAEDVTQEAFLQAYVKLNTFQQKSSFYTWLYRIAVNIAYSMFRKKKPVINQNNLQLDLHTKIHDQPSQVGDDLERDEQIEQLYRALSELSPEHRAILLLREIEENDYETISAILDLPLGTVRSRLHRARIQLRDQLKNLI